MVGSRRLKTSADLQCLKPLIISSIFGNQLSHDTHGSTTISTAKHGMMIQMMISVLKSVLEHSR